MSQQLKFILDEAHIPSTWYNLAADLPAPLPPPLNPATRQPLAPLGLAPLFPMALIMQEVSTERQIEIPDPIREVYRMWRPSPLIRARRLEQVLDTPAKIYYKYEGISPAGSHKPNTAVPQAWYNKQEGITRLATETGAGQWGSSLAFAGALFGMEVTVLQVRVSYDQKPYRRALMETYGARCLPSPSMETEAGRAILAQHPQSPGSLGIAISEAVEMAAKDEAVKYSLGSVLNHVLLHQTVIGLEAIKQLELAGDDPDVIIIPPALHSGGLRYHGMAPMVSHVAELGLIEARALHQKTCFDAAVQFARCEGIVPAPEAAHAVRCAIDEALRCKAEGRAETILFNLSGHGHFDMGAYIAYFEGKLVDQAYDEAELAQALKALPVVES